MKDSSMIQLGGLCAIVAGLLFLGAGILALIFQLSTFEWNNIPSMATFYSTAPGGFLSHGLVNWGAVLGSFLAIATVLAISDLMLPSQTGWLRYTSTLAIIGFTIIALTNMADLDRIQRLIAGYGWLEPSGQSVLDVLGIASLDPDLYLRNLTLGRGISPSTFWLGEPENCHAV